MDNMAGNPVIAPNWGALPQQRNADDGPAGLGTPAFTFAAPL